MISSKLFRPESIIIVGGSENKSKPGGKILENLIIGGFKNLTVVNPGNDFVQGIKSYPDPDSVPVADLAILAIPAKNCIHAIKSLSSRGVEAFIIISAGFAELDENGKMLEDEIKDFAKINHLTILGPNCIGIINQYYKGVFTLPVPEFNPAGIDFFSSSGSVAVFTMEAGLKKGLQVSGIYSVGNAALIKIEDLLEYHDDSFVPGISSNVLMIYIEQISDPGKFIKHCRSLKSKGCDIVGIKSGLTDAGMRAASSHTGAMASTEVVVNSIFKKAGVIQCDSREEMIAVAGVLYYGKPKGKNVAVITHAGGSGVMAADALEKNGMSVPEIKGEKAEYLLSKLFQGSSVANPVDFLATGTAEQLGLIIDYCNEYFDNIDEIIVIFGSPGLFDVAPVYDVLSEKIKKSPKPVYPVLPSLINTEKATVDFVNNNNLFFSDEVSLAKAMAKVYNQYPLFHFSEWEVPALPDNIKRIITGNKDKYLDPEDAGALLNHAGIASVPEYIVNKGDDLDKILGEIPFPVVFKAIGPLHKSDMGGVILGIDSRESAFSAFKKLMDIPSVTACLIQPMLSGIELFAGAKRDDTAGHVLMFGMGGIYLEILKDVQSTLSPAGFDEILYMIRNLKSYPILNGARGKTGIDIDRFASILLSLSELLTDIPEISEIDINPLIANENGIFSVDSRIKIDF